MSSSETYVVVIPILSMYENKRVVVVGVQASCGGTDQWRPAAQLYHWRLLALMSLRLHELIAPKQTLDCGHISPLSLPAAIRYFKKIELVHESI